MQQAQSNRSPLSAIRKTAPLTFLLLAAGACGRIFWVTYWPALFAGAAGLAAAFREPALHANAIRYLSPLMLCFNLIAAGYVLLRLPPFLRMLPSRGERLIFAPLAGGVFSSLLTLAAGLHSTSSIRWATLLFFWSMAPLFLLVALREHRQKPIPPPRPFPRSPIIVIAALGLLAIGLLSFLYASAPSVESDELRYHVAALQTWMRDGSIHYLPHQAFSNFPMLGEMLFLAAIAPAYSAAHDPLFGMQAHLVHLFFLPVAMGLMGLIAGRLLRQSGVRGELRRRRLALLAAALLAFIPCVPILAAWGFIDLFVVGYFLGFVYLAGRSISRPSRASGALIGMIAAGAISTKYTMLPLLGALGILWLAFLLTAPAARKRAARLILATSLFACLLGGPWYLKNFIWTGNPFYPLAWSIFHGGDWSAANAVFYAAKAAEKGYFGFARLQGAAPAWSHGAFGHLLEFAMTPWTTLVAFDRFESHPLGLLPLLFLLLALGGIFLGKSRLHRPRFPFHSLAAFVAAAALISWAFWFATYQSNRMLLPTIALVIPLGVATLPRWRAAFPRLSPALCALIGAGMLYGFILFLYLLGARNPNTGLSKSDAIAVALGSQAPEVYLKRNLNYYAAAQWLGDEKALLVGEHRTLYFDDPVVASDWFDTPQPLPWIRKTPNNDAMLDAMLAGGIRTIFYNELELSYYLESYFRPRFTPAEYARFEDLLQKPNPRLKLLKEIDRPGFEHVLIYAILPGPAKPATSPAPRG